jgi:hypothetical protein
LESSIKQAIQQQMEESKTTKQMAIQQKAEFEKMLKQVEEKAKMEKNEVKIWVFQVTS